MKNSNPYAPTSNAVNRDDPTVAELHAAALEVKANPALAAKLKKLGISVEEYAKHGHRADQLADRNAVRSHRG